MFNSKGNIPSDQLRRLTNALRKQLHEMKCPLVLTVNCRAELILQEARAYQQLLARLQERNVWKAESAKHKNAAGAR